VTPRNDARALPAHRAFVVQLHAGADPARRLLSGRVEHVVSGESAHFDTLGELLAFMARRPATPPGGAGRPARGRRTEEEPR
jgi:hypothetical protein